jgi:hypothetical protein
MRQPTYPLVVNPLVRPPRPTVHPTFPAHGIFGGWGPRVR